MNIDLFISEEQLDKLVSNFIQLQYKESSSNVQERSKKEVILLNSILVTLNTNKNGLATLLNQIKYALEVSSNDRKSMERAGHLLLQVNKRSPNLTNKSSLQVLQEIVTLSCQKAFIAVCGNTFIAVLQQLFYSLSFSESKFNQLFMKLIQFLSSPKLLVSTYRQQTRLCLYKLYLKGLHFYSSLQKEHHQLKIISQQSLVQKCIKSGSGEKDPRNIGFVFQIYLKILQMFPLEKLSEFRSQIFQNLQSYYPIQFIGDQDNEEHKKINLRQISQSLDKCITHPFFKQLTWQLFTTKLSAPPISPFVPTFLLYISRRKSDSSFEQFAERLSRMLLRLSQQQYIEENYPENQPDLGNLLVAILQYIFYREDGTYTIQGYQIVMNWLQLMVNRVILGQCKHSGTMMGIFRCIIKSKKNRQSTTLIQLFRSYALRKIINILCIQNEIIPKLGLAIVALAQLDNVNQNLNQLIGLLIIQVGRLYSQASDQVKMLLLKILLQIYQGRQENKVMVRKVNDSFILKDCLARWKEAFSNDLDPTQIFLVKAFIDYVATVYINQIDIILSHIEGTNFELEAYLIARLLESCNHQLVNVPSKQKKLQLIVTKMNILISKMKTNNEKDAIFNAFTVIPHQSCLFLIKKINWFLNSQYPKLIFNLYLQMKTNILMKEKDQQQSKFDQISIQMTKGILQNRQTIDNQFKGIILIEKIWRKLINQQDNTLTFPGVNQFNSSLQQHNFQFEESLILGYQPTFIHWQWENLHIIQNQQAREQRLSLLINYLPEKLLLRDSQKVLQFAVKNERQTSSLFKVVKHLDINSLRKTGIIQYCLQYLEQLQNSQNTDKSTERSACVLAIFIDILDRDKSNQLKQTLKKKKRLLNSLLLHRKRPIRQGIRKMLLMIEE